MATPINTINHDKLFKNCPNKFNVGRYHSWVINRANLPENLIVTAVDNNNNIMAVRHKTHDVCGVQFHPESILSEYGETIISNWIEG
jgi:anthranilate synthase component 2